MAPSAMSSESSIDEPTAFPGIPPFPNNVPTAPLLRISLEKLINGDVEEDERVWKACCELGFFYLDLRMPEQSHSEHGQEGSIDGNRLLSDADALFGVAEELFDLPVTEKMNYDFKDKGSYFGYKGYGDGIISATGTPDRNEFYNVSKDDILHITPSLPAPALLTPHRPLLASYITTSHALVTLLLRLLNRRLGLPAGKLESLHRLDAISGDQVRFVKAPPQPEGDRRTALGAHTDFGSVTVLFNRVGGLQVRLPRGVEAVAPASSPSSQSSSSGSDGMGSDGGAAGEEEEQWAYVRPLPCHAIINLGDALVKFTSGILRSNIHRVVSPPGSQADTTRYSLVYFARPEDDVVLRRLEGSAVIDEAARARGLLDGGEEVISSKEWILRRALGRRQGGNWERSAGTEEVSMRKG